MSAPLLQANITASYGKARPVLEQVKFEIFSGEVLGLVGQSGSGKSTMALALLRLLRFRNGHQTGLLRFEGKELLDLPEREMRRLRGSRIGFVPQSPASALNPMLRLRTHLQEAWRAHSPGSPAWQQVLESVSLPATDSFLDRYPREISVGQGQRFLIAMGVLHHPALLIADEPTSALDVITQSEILALFRNLSQDLGMAVLYISHDLLSVASLCHRVAILESGRLIEVGETSQIFQAPQKPYTQRLVAAMPTNPWPQASFTKTASLFS